MVMENRLLILLNATSSWSNISSAYEVVSYLHLVISRRATIDTVYLSGRQEEEA